MKKSLSRTVHNDQDHAVLYDQLDQRPKIDTTETTTTTTTTSNSMSLTVWRKSLLINCNGFTVIDSNGDLIYRVDNYVIRPQEIILMNASGESILTMRRRKKKLGLVDNWFVYEGEISDDQEYYYKRTSSLSTPKKPIYCIKKNINNPLISTKPNNVIAHIYRDERLAYAIEGSYRHRSCKVLDIGGSKDEVVAETRSKEEIVRGVSYSYGVDVFQLIVHPGFDPSFAMALVLLLDQMF